VPTNKRPRQYSARASTARQMRANRHSPDDERRMAANFAKLPELVRRKADSP
jgi:hypothetical protein